MGGKRRRKRIRACEIKRDRQREMGSRKMYAGLFRTGIASLDYHLFVEALKLKVSEKSPAGWMHTWPDACPFISNNLSSSKLSLSLITLVALESTGVRAKESIAFVQTSKSEIPKLKLKVLIEWMKILLATDLPFSTSP